MSTWDVGAEMYNVSPSWLNNSIPACLVAPLKALKASQTKFVTLVLFDSFSID